MTFIASLVRCSGRYLGVMSARMLETCRVGSRLNLSDHDPRETFGWDKETAKAQLTEELAALSDLQTRLFAAEHDAVLVVLQAMDAGGKDGVLRALFTGINPAGVERQLVRGPVGRGAVTRLSLARTSPVPPKGVIGIFNRSHYEDVLVVRVKQLVPAARWKKRYGEIVDFEQMLTAEGTHIVKLFLNISKEEQRVRLQDRIDTPEKHWKFRRGDLDDRALWDDFMQCLRRRPRARRRLRRRRGTSCPPTASGCATSSSRRFCAMCSNASILEFPEPDDDISGLVVT